jgi:hypothetical protein
LHFLYPFLFLSSPDLCPVHTLYDTPNIIIVFLRPPRSIVLLISTLPFSFADHHHFRLLSIHFQLFLPHILSQVLLHFSDFSITLYHNYQIIPKCQAPNLLSTYHTPPACAFFNISSIFAIYQGASGQPCLTPFVVSNHSPSFSPTFTLFFVLAPQSSVPAIRFSSLSLFLIHSNIFSVSTLSNAALTSTNSGHIPPPFFFNLLFVK